MVLRTNCLRPVSHALVPCRRATQCVLPALRRLQCTWLQPACFCICIDRQLAIGKPSVMRWPAVLLSSVQELRTQLCSRGAAGAPLLLQAYLAGGEAARVADMVTSLYCEDGSGDADALMETYRSLAGLVRQQDPATVARCAARLLPGRVCKGAAPQGIQLAPCSPSFHSQDTTASPAASPATLSLQQVRRGVHCGAISHISPPLDVCLILAGENGWAACVTVQVRTRDSNDTELLDKERWVTTGPVVPRPRAANGTAGDGMLAAGVYDISWSLPGTRRPLCEVWNASASSWDVDPSSPTVDLDLYTISLPPQATYQVS